MYLGLWENHRKRLIQEYSPDEDSPIGRLIAEADALEAERETFQEPYTAASERIRALESAIYKPRPAAGYRLGVLESAELERQTTELEEAWATAERIGHELASRSNRIKEIQLEITEMLKTSTIDAAARQREMEKVLRV
jgi:hypothetical protein